jgi:Pilus formation protein N terminal region
MGEVTRGRNYRGMMLRGCLAGLSFLAWLYPTSLAAGRGEAAAASTSVRVAVTATVLPRQQPSVISVETFAKGDAMIVKVSKGVPPYRVRVENGGVAKVVRIDPHTFKIVGRKAGESVLVITDSKGNKAECGVSCSLMVRTERPAAP